MTGVNSSSSSPHYSQEKSRRSSRNRTPSSRDSHHSNGVGSAGIIDNELGIPFVKFFLDNRLPVDYFKQDIINLIHALRLPRWKAVTKAMAPDIVVQRISGALTNAIYSVDPPVYLRELIKSNHNEACNQGKTYHHRVPQKLLLRVYGPQVGHLIDRDIELDVLYRLSLRQIGPKLLGTFENGRFEQFFNARPLTKEGLREPDTSVQIAKRMRELHDGVSLTTEEREKGPGVWNCIWKWMKRAIQVLNELEAKQPGAIFNIIQSDLDTFINALKSYQEWIIDKSGGIDSVKNQLVFAHNDTQYGNILRVEPPKGSPLLSPQLEHRQLIVIDFEYSGPNIRAVDIGNHFVSAVFVYISYFVALLTSVSGCLIIMT